MKKYLAEHAGTSVPVFAGALMNPARSPGSDAVGGKQPTLLIWPVATVGRALPAILCSRRISNPYFCGYNV
jgi:hypothetical protein